MQSIAHQPFPSLISPANTFIPAPVRARATAANPVPSSSTIRHPTPYTVISYEPLGVRSDRCKATVSIHGQCCSSCAALSLEINQLRVRAAREPKGLTTDLLSWAQLRTKLEDRDTQIRSMHLRIKDLEESLQTARSGASHFEELYAYLQETPVPALQRIFRNSRKQAWGVRETLRRCKRAVAGDYHPEHWFDWEIDLALLTYEIGGLGLVHALHKSMLQFPCRTTLRKLRVEAKLQPCISGVRFTDVYANISTYYSDQPAPAVRYLHTACFDETAKTAAIDWFSLTDEFGGLCLEHIDAVLDGVQVGDTVELVEKAVQLVRDGKVHIATEISVGAIFRHAETNYAAKPVFMGSSCKMGNWLTVLLVILTVLEAWERHPDGASKRGPIASVASDGDAKRRIAFFVLCMCFEVKEGNEIYEYVRDVCGLNLFTGKNNITMDFDPKHELKRICTTLRSTSGIVIKGVCINRDLLLHWLERLEGVDWSEASIQVLLNPIDGQHVPRAHKLLTAIIAIETDPGTKDVKYNPTEAAQFEALCLFGRVLQALLDPLTDTSLSLQEQMTSFMKFSYMLAALYLQNNTSFVPNQLYGDLQAMIKNSIFMVAKTKAFNPALRVFTCLLGDDVLETFFGVVRMIAGHDPNTGLADFCRYSSSATHIQTIFERRPELKRTGTRLDYARMGHVDHLRPSHWKRDLSAGSCDLGACSRQAMAEAIADLEKFNAPLTIWKDNRQTPTTFVELFSRPKTDLLRPMGGKYPSVSGDVDRSLGEAAGTATADVDLDSTQYKYDNPYSAYSTEEILERERIVPLIPPHIRTPYALVDNTSERRVHKSSAVRILFAYQDFAQARDRLHRVRGFSAGGKLAWAKEGAEGAVVQSPATHLRLQDLFATLISHNGTDLSLAVGIVTSIVRRGASSSAIPRSDLLLADSEFTISGQVFGLLPFSTVSEDGAPLWSWAWDQSFVFLSQLKNASAAETAARAGNIKISIPSKMVLPLAESAIELDASTVPVPMTASRDSTWSFTHEALCSAWAVLYNRILSDESLHSQIPRYTRVITSNFPYQHRSTDGSGGAFSIPIKGTAIEAIFLDAGVCRLCGKKCRAENRQNHVGEHLLRKLFGVLDPKLKIPIATLFPCGFCGGPGAGCSISIQGGKARSNCPLAYKFLVRAAASSSDAKPSTNVPIKCTYMHCDEIHWKYNFPQHLDRRHPNWHQNLPEDSPLHALLEISPKEQEKLGIPQDRQRQRWYLFTEAASISASSPYPSHNDTFSPSTAPNNPPATPRRRGQLRRENLPGPQHSPGNSPSKRRRIG
ncbi:hypothetical protein MKEN_00968800 [Mycena kentingensis (nom. inval.)]|nr:hypothetical protein MKEN_00968800 [Mycena kentingensis (nom. inval.)]